MKTNTGYVRVREIDEAGVLSLESMLVGFDNFVKLLNKGIIIKKGAWYVLNRKKGA